MFRDREDAGHRLAAHLQGGEFIRPLVLAIPRGGIVTGAALALELGAEFDAVLSRKLRSPDEPELAFGAINEDGQVYINEEAAEAAGVNDAYFHRERQHNLAIINARKRLIRQARTKATIQGRTAIVTDDGMATGSTLIAALDTVRAQDPAALIAAIPVAPADRLRDVAKHCDRVVCLLPAQHFWAVGQYYEDYPTIEDEQVMQILRRFEPQGV